MADTKAPVAKMEQFLEARGRLELLKGIRDRIQAGEVSRAAVQIASIRIAWQSAPTVGESWLDLDHYVARALEAGLLPTMNDAVQIARAEAQALKVEAKAEYDALMAGPVP